MQEQWDAQRVAARVQGIARVIRQSEVYPALVGGMAGGIAGALMAVWIAGRLAARNQTPREPHRESKGSRFDLSVREAIQLVTIVASLIKQIQAWAKERGKS